MLRFLALLYSPLSAAIITGFVLQVYQFNPVLVIVRVVLDQLFIGNDSFAVMLTRASGLF